MADEPISALTLFTSYSTADEVEILDVSDTTFASTGTNKRIPFSTLLTMAGVGCVAGGGTGLTAVGSADQLLGVAHTGGALEYKTLTAGPNVTITPAAGSITIASTGGGGGTSNPMTTAGDTIYGGASGTPERLAIGSSGQVLTVTSGNPAWGPPTIPYANAVLSTSGSPYVLTSSSYTNIGLALSIPSAGVWMVTGLVRTLLNVTSGPVNDFGAIAIQIRDTTNSAVVASSQYLVAYQPVWVSGANVNQQYATSIGPVFYTASGAATLNLQYLIAGSATFNANMYSDGNGLTQITALLLS